MTTVAAAALLTLAVVLVSFSGAAAQQRPTVQASSELLFVWFTQGSASVNPLLGTATVSGGYTCQDNLGTTQVQIEVTFTQDTSDAEGSTDITRPCQVANGTWAVTVGPDLLQQPFVPNETILAEVAIVKIDHVEQYATASALLIRDQFFLKNNPTVTRNRNGTVNVSGTYGCAASWGPTVRMHPVFDGIASDGAEVSGVAVVNLACPATNQPWSAVIAASASSGTAGVGVQILDISRALNLRNILNGPIQANLLSNVRNEGAFIGARSSEIGNE